MTGGAAPPVRVLITGGSAGIGLALAQQYQAEGAEVLTIGRRPNGLGGLPYICLDLLAGDALARIDAALTQNGWDTFDILILNAGVGHVGPLAETPAPIARDMITVNTAMPLAMAHHFADRVTGRIVFIGSTATWGAHPDFAVYAASKAALRGAVRAWQIERCGARPLKRFQKKLTDFFGSETRKINIVQIIHPGPTQTQMHDRAGLPDSPIRRLFTPAPVVAKSIQHQIQNGRGEVRFGIAYTLWKWAMAEWGGQHGRGLACPKPPKAPPKTAPSPQQSGVKTVLITGAANGLGRAMLDQRVAEGWHIIAVDRDTRPLQGQARVTPCQVDLADPLATSKILPHLSRPLDQLIHCAGISATGAFADIAWAEQRAVLQINLTAPILLTLALLQGNTLRRGAAVCFVSSLSHFTSYPGAATYAGSKDGLAAFARSLAKAHKDLSITTAFPGPLRTDHAERYAPDNSDGAVKRRMDPHVAARIILRDVDRGRRSSLPGGMAKVAATMGRIAPRTTARVMRKVMFEPLNGVRVDRGAGVTFTPRNNPTSYHE